MARGQSRVYIIPAWMGVTLSLSVLIVTLVAAIFNSTPVFILAFLMLTLGMLSMVQTNANLQGIEVVNVETSPAPADAEIPVTIHLKNTSKQTRYSLSVELRSARHLVVQSKVGVIPAQSVFAVSLRHPALTRGCHGLPNIRVASLFPLGTCYAWKTFKVEHRIFVYPRPRGSQPLPHKGNGGVNKGQTSTGSGGDEFFDHRPYREGDSFRHIDWRARARGQQLLIKQFNADVSAARVLRWDALTADTSEAKLEQLAEWVCRLTTTNDAFAMFLPGDEVPTGKGKAHTVIALKKLAVFNEQDQRSA